MVNSQQSVAMTSVGNTRETIAEVRGSFALLFPVCLAGMLEILSGATKSLRKWDGIKQRLLI